MNNKYNSVSKIKENHKYKFSNKDTFIKDIKWSKDLKYIDLGEFKTFFQCYVPKSISEDVAKSKIFTILVSYASLNKSKIKLETLVKLANTCNNRVKGNKLTEEELNKCVKKAFAERCSFKPKDNSAVRYIKNPILEFNVTEMKRETSKLKKEADIKRLCEFIGNWDYDKNGTPNQENLAILMGCSRRTIIRKMNDSDFPSDMLELWEEIKQCFKSGMISPTKAKKEKLKINVSKKNVGIKRIKLNKTNIKNVKKQIINKPVKSKKEQLNSFFVNKISMCQLT